MKLETNALACSSGRSLLRMLAFYRIVMCRLPDEIPL